MAEVVIQFAFTDDQSTELVKELFGEEIIVSLSDASWKIRLECVDKLLELLEEKLSKDAGCISGEALVRSLKQTGVWRDNNFQVSAKLYMLLAKFVSLCQNVEPSVAAIVVPLLVEKVGDVKLKTHVTELLFGLCERLSLQVVLSQGMSVKFNVLFNT